MGEFVLPKGWPFPDLPSNTPWEEAEFGVFEDRRDRGRGIALVETTRDIFRALDSAASFDGKAHVRKRLVRRSEWSSPFYDDRHQAEPSTADPTTPDPQPTTEDAS